MKVDAHHHLWDLAVRDQLWTAELPALQRSFGLDDLAPQLAHHGIDRTVLVQTVAVGAETQELLALADREPVIAGVVGWIDLSRPDVAEQLDRLLAGPGGRRLVGIRSQLPIGPDGLLPPESYIEGLGEIGDHGLAFDLLITPEQFATVIATVAALPGVRFVLDHGGNPAIDRHDYAEWHRQLVGLASYDNIAVKLSGLLTRDDHDRRDNDRIMPYARALITAFGPDRVLYGSDWPVCNLAGGYPRTIELVDQAVKQLSQDQRELIMGGTAAVWYQLNED